MDAATGEVYIKDTSETILGSAGQALELKLGGSEDTERLKLVLVEQDPGCYEHLKRVIERRWPEFPVHEAEGPIEGNKTGVYLLRMREDHALTQVERIGHHSDLGRSIFLFDPLRSVDWEIIQNVARKRITTFYKIGTEFIIFLFTSDLFMGRDGYSPLPSSYDEGGWTNSQRETVSEVDSLLGGKSWRSQVLRGDPVPEREGRIVELYKRRLHSWFRYVLPLPFAPKKEQIYHLFVCSNFEVGIRVTRDSFFCPRTGNEKYAPDIDNAYREFRHQHPSMVVGLSGRIKPVEFRFLWKVIREHEGGNCDVMSQDLIRIEPDRAKRAAALDWLKTEGYIKSIRFDDEWGLHPPTFTLDWTLVEKRLGIMPPASLSPLLPASIGAR